MSELFERLKAALQDRYEIESEIGAGGMAVVYRAMDLKHDRPVALKVLRPEISAAMGADRFLREIQLVARLTHPHVLPLHDSGEAAGLLYYVMPFIEGESLRDRLDRDGPLSIDEALRIVREAGSALSHAHERGIIHRDVKPGNILLSDGHAIVADFGIARALDEAGEESLTGTGLSVGTPNYMSPEQATGGAQVDARSDEYALACVLYETLTGQPPFSGPTPQALMARHALDPVPSMRTVRGTIPAPLEEAVERALAKLPADRYPTVEAFVEAMATEGSTVREPAPVPAETASKSNHGRRRLALVAAAITGIAAVALLARQLDIGGLFTPPPEQERIAVLDFQAVGLTPDLAYLAQAVPEFLSLSLTGETGGAKAVDRRQVIRAWERARGASSDPVLQREALMRQLGATHVITGQILPQPNGRVLAQAELRRGREIVLDAGPVVLPASEAIAVAESLGVQLLAASAGEIERLSGLVSSSTEAVQEWLVGTLNFRSGEWKSAAAHFSNALDQDSTFALAAWGLMNSASWAEGLGNEYERGRRLAWQHQDRLPPADSTVFVIESRRNGYPEPEPGLERAALRNFERAVQRFPDSWMAWIRYGDYLFHEGGVYADDARSRSVDALLRAVALDTLGNAEPYAHLADHYALTGDTAGFFALPREHQPADYAALMTLQYADLPEGLDTWQRLEEEYMPPIVALLSLQASGLGMENAERLAAILEERARDGDPNSAGVVGMFALNRGQPERATPLLEIASRPHEYCGNASCMPPVMWIQQALLHEGNEDVARRVRDSLATALADLDPMDFTSDDPAVWRPVREGLRPLTWVAIWDLAHGDTTGAAGAIEYARIIRELADGYLGTERYALLNETFLEALLALETGAPGAAEAVARADSAFHQGVAVRHRAAYLVLLAQMHERIGDHRSALNRYRREWLGTGEEQAQFRTTRLLGRARNAAALGYRDEALDTYERYLAFRSDPEPALQDRIAAVRKEYEALRAAGR